MSLFVSWPDLFPLPRAVWGGDLHALRRELAASYPLSIVAADAKFWKTGRFHDYWKDGLSDDQHEPPAESVASSITVSKQRAAVEVQD